MVGGTSVALLVKDGAWGDRLCSCGAVCWASAFRCYRHEVMLQAGH